MLKRKKKNHNTHHARLVAGKKKLRAVRGKNIYQQEVSVRYHGRLKEEGELGSKGYWRGGEKLHKKRCV